MRGFVQDSVYIGKSNDHICVERFSHQRWSEDRAAPIAPAPGLRSGCQFSIEERTLIAEHSAIADVIHERTSITNTAGWESF